MGRDTLENALTKVAALRAMRILAALLVASVSMAPSAGFGRPQQPTPPRDRPSSAQTGTASIRGRVLAADTGKPLRRVRITATAPELQSEPRITSTDADGRYALTDLPAGRYTVRAARSGYLQLLYGQRRPREPGRPLQILDKQVVEHVDFAMPRTAIISGRVLDETGDPIEGVDVYAVRSMFRDGRRQLVPTGVPHRTDAGQYRLLGLSPGTYSVVARTSESWTIDRQGVTQVMGYAPTYFPGTTQPGDGKRITVRVGQEVGDTDFALIPGRMARVSGTAFDSHGRPFSTVSVRQETRGEDFGAFRGIATAPVNADGRFSISAVPPGEFIISASTPRDSAEPQVAQATITVDGVDIDDVALTGSQGAVVSGRVLTDEGTIPNLPHLRITIAEPLTGQPSPVLLGAFGNPGSSEVAADGTFTVKGVFGRSWLRMGLPDGWAVKAVFHEDRDISDLPIDLKSGETMSAVQVILTSRVTSVSGDLVDDKGRPVTDGTVIVFPVDADKWPRAFRFVRAVRPDQQGHWTIAGLPPGDFLAVAVDYVEDGQWNDPEFLDSLAAHGQRVTLVEGSPQVLALKIITSTERG